MSLVKEYFLQFAYHKSSLRWVAMDSYEIEPEVDPKFLIIVFAKRYQNLVAMRQTA